MIWLAIALMTAAVALCLLWPLAGGAGATPPPPADVAFYASQLTEVEGDVARGIISAGDADATRTEIARRLLASARAATPPPAPRSRALRLGAIAAAVLAVPALSLGLYAKLGSPSAPDMPLEQRPDVQARNVAAAIPRIEAHLATHPEDGRGFSLIAPIYLRMGRFDDAAKAYAAALQALGENAEMRAMLGQALVMAADGVVTRDARAAFDQALADDPKLPQARFFQAVLAEQDNDKERALALWRAMLADSPAGAPWLPAVQQHIAVLTGAAPPPPADAGAPAGPAAAAIAALPADQQREAIHGMVDALASRLAQNGRDVEGWLRLIRAYKVLGEQDKARAAIADARKGLDGDAASVTRIDALGRELGLEG